jgi:hypothetical protein
MADKRFRGRDKIVQKMTKDGLVEENLRTGETKSAVAEEPPKQEDSENFPMVLFMYVGTEIRIIIHRLHGEEHGLRMVELL